MFRAISYLEHSDGLIKRKLSSLVILKIIKEWPTIVVLWCTGVHSHESHDEHRGNISKILRQNLFLVVVIFL